MKFPSQDRKALLSLAYRLEVLTVMQSAQLEVGGLVIGLTLADISKHMILFLFLLCYTVHITVILFLKVFPFLSKMREML